MLRTTKPPQIRRANKPLRLPLITTTNRSAPDRPTIVSVILQDIRLVKVTRPDRVADVAHGDGEGAFPGHALGAGVAPAARQRRFGARRGRAGVVVVFGDVVGVEGGVDYVLWVCLLGWWG